MDKVRALMFINKFKMDTQTIDLHMYFRRVNYVSNIYKNANMIMMELDDPEDHGWDQLGNAIWSTDWYPTDIADLLLNQNEREDEKIFYDTNDDDVGEDLEYR